MHKEAFAAVKNSRFDTVKQQASNIDHGDSGQELTKDFRRVLCVNETTCTCDALGNRCAFLRERYHIS